MARQILSYTYLLIGVVGLFLPFLPGIPFLVLGIGLLDQDHWLRKRASSLLNRRKTKVDIRLSKENDGATS
jgi:uncharacterized membrane protein YbaN (DUF454 family)